MAIAVHARRESAPGPAVKSSLPLVVAIRSVKAAFVLWIRFVAPLHGTLRVWNVQETAPDLTTCVLKPRAWLNVGASPVATVCVTRPAGRIVSHAPAIVENAHFSVRQPT